MTAAPLNGASGFQFATLLTGLYCSLFLDQALFTPLTPCLPLQVSEFAGLP